MHVQTNGRSILREGCDPIKERNKQKREAMRNLHNLKDIALEAFESGGAELKRDGKACDWFHQTFPYF